ncbi:hypothetical protein BDR26DRAFT_869585 [Obelidium mucronatum]|nr:hypothetical protein BDR26DRAFT_869585 [Obelidium mucronatum]
MNQATDDSNAEDIFKATPPHTNASLVYSTPLSDGGNADLNAYLQPQQQTFNHPEAASNILTAIRTINKPQRQSGAQNSLPRGRSLTDFSKKPYNRPSNHLSNDLTRRCLFPTAPPPLTTAETASLFYQRTLSSSTPLTLSKVSGILDTPGAGRVQPSTTASSSTNDSEAKEATYHKRHREAEKQRRESLRLGFEQLKGLLPASMTVEEKSWSQVRLLEYGLEYIIDLKKRVDAKALENFKLLEVLRKFGEIEKEGER